MEITPGEPLQHALVGSCYGSDGDKVVVAGGKHRYGVSNAVLVMTGESDGWS